LLTRSFPRSRPAFAVIIIAASLLIIVKGFMLENPIMPGDEYAYFSAAQTFPDSTHRFAGDPYLPRIYSPLFAAYGRALISISDHPTQLLELLNAVTFVAAIALFLALITKLRGRQPSALVAAAFLLFPFSSYAAYFMPETVYLLFFGLLAWAVVLVVPRQPLAGAALAGAIVGAMLLIKPHAIALFAAAVLTLAAGLIAPSSIRSRVGLVAGSIMAFVGSTYLVLVVVNRLLTGTLALHPFMFVGGLYRPNLAQGTSLSSWTGNPVLFTSILGGHVIVLAALVAPAFAVAADRLRALYASPGPADQSSRTFYMLAAFTILATLCAVGMTTNFEVQASYLSPLPYVRMHGRYYSFVVPLCLTLFFVARGRGVSGPRTSLLLPAAAIAIGAALLVVVVRARVIYPFDFPEAFVFSTWHGRERVGLLKLAVTAMPYGAILAVAVAYTLMVWRGQRAAVAYSVLLIGLASLSHVGVFGWQRANAAQHAALHADARMMKSLIPAASHDKGLIVGPEWNEVLAHFLYNFESSPHVLVRPEGSRLTKDDVPADAEWAILIGNYAMDFPSQPWQRTALITCVRLTPRETDEPAR
jgi:phosphoglycerol transferase